MIILRWVGASKGTVGNDLAGAQKWAPEPDAVFDLTTKVTGTGSSVGTLEKGYHL